MHLASNTTKQSRGRWRHPREVQRWDVLLDVRLRQLLVNTLRPEDRSPVVNQALRHNSRVTRCMCGPDDGSRETKLLNGARSQPSGAGEPEEPEAAQVALQDADE
eukprot:9471711-Pyramimonas_sp.AAC.1